MFVTSVSVMILLQKPTDGPKVQQPQPEVSKDAESDEFNSFQFWREPLPALDSELLGLLVGQSKRKQCGDTPDSCCDDAKATVVRCRLFRIRWRL